MYPDGTLLYGPPDPKIYVIKGGARHWIPNPQTFNADGYNWSAIVQTDMATLDSIALGAPITTGPSNGPIRVLRRCSLLLRRTPSRPSTCSRSGMPTTSRPFSTSGRLPGRRSATSPRPQAQSPSFSRPSDMTSPEWPAQRLR